MFALLAPVALLAQAGFTRPEIDYHAIAPEIVLTGALLLVLLVDLLKPEGDNPLLSTVAGLGLLGAMIPILSLATDGADRSLFGGAYVVDNFSLVLKALFLLSAYLVVLMSTNYIAEGDYAEGEYYFLLLSSVLGMLLMASARDLITVFVALELLSIPAYMLAGWRKRDLMGNEAGVKYYLMGVFASAILLYGMSLLFGIAGDTRLSVIGAKIAGADGNIALVTLAIVFTVVGFAFKVSAVPFHTWAPDTYEGAPTPITAFLAVASKAAGFVALLQVIFVAFPGRTDVVEPLMWVLAALTMTIGNMIALRQTNVIRMLAYSGVAQAGFMLAPLAVGSDLSARAVVTYLVIYAAMNLGAFAVVIAIARKTRSAEIASFGGLFEYARRAHRGHVLVPVQPGRHPAHGRVAGQVRGVPHPGRRQHRLRLRARRLRGRELGHRALLLRQRRPRDVDEAGARRGPHADRGALRHPGRHRAGGDRHRRVRRVRSRHPHRRPRHLPPRRLPPLGRRAGPRSRVLRVDEFVERALYDAERGFYETGGRAGRRDATFLTSPEVGPLFGAVLARALDTWWDAAGRPGEWTVVDAGAGPGTLARAILAAEPACAGVLRLVNVERAAAQRRLHPAPAESFGNESAQNRSRTDETSTDRLPSNQSAATLPRAADVIIANELLDNLPFGLLERTAQGWLEVHVGPDGATRPDTGGPRVPVAAASAAWVADARRRLNPGGRLVCFDYADTTAALAARPWTDWVRAFADQEQVEDPFVLPGSRDVTVVVPHDQLPPPTRSSTQAEWLEAHGIADLVAAGRRHWEAHAAQPDLAAMRMRSRVTESEALLDPAGLGAFWVGEWDA